MRGHCSEGAFGGSQARGLPPFRPPCEAPCTCSASLQAGARTRPSPPMQFVGLGAACSPVTRVHSTPSCWRLCRTSLRMGYEPRARTLRSSFRRLTITASRCFASVTATPRVKRCGSSSSRRAAKLLECPLWGVALRKRRFSKRGATSRITLVILESFAYLPAEAGAATCASSRTRRLRFARSPRVLKSGSRYSGRRSRSCEMMNRLCVLQGLTPKPRSRRRRSTNARFMTSNRSPNRFDISSRH